jgi:small subunit ribosomal protein S4
LGFSRTRAGARQLVAHGHVCVNGRKLDVSSANLRPGDKVAIKDVPGSKRLAQRGVELSVANTPDWLVVDKENLTGEVMRIPTREEINPIANEQLVVELYSR